MTTAYFQEAVYFIFWILDLNGFMGKRGNPPNIASNFNNYKKIKNRVII